ncbi:MFS transporter [Microbispora catharanthi]|uniref:MFS transporter n=1 Tax=Microbispora catharanthi TaxID=1712871 RepID=A0A5N6C2V1_9ACTN|nr:MFS transporter [Microbispora catharanthi]KAB8187019.1 MFS transporter [Microbispora catharanthi]
MSTSTPVVSAPAGPAAPATPRETYAPVWRTVAAFVPAGLLATGHLYVVIPLLARMSADWGAPAAVLTWLVSAFGLGYAGGFLLFGPLSDLYGRRRVMTWGMAATAVTTALVALSPGPGAALALRVVEGVTTAVFAPTAFAYIAERVEPRRRAVTMTSVVSALFASAVVAQLAAKVLVDLLGWRPVFLLGGAAFAVVTVVLRRVMLPDTARRTGANPYAVVPALLRDPRLVLVYAATLTVLGAFVALYTALQLEGPAGIAGDPSALLTLRATALPAIIAIPFATPYLARLSPARRAALALGLAAVLALVVGLAAPGVTALAVLLAVFAFAIGVAAPAVIETVGLLAGPARGTAVSLFTFFLFTGASIGPVVASAAAPYGFAALMYGVAGVLALGGGLVLIASSGRRIR